MLIHNTVADCRFGQKLLAYSMEKAWEMGAGALEIIGNNDFVTAKSRGIRYVEDPEAERAEAAFPPKGKLKLPGQ